MLMLTCHSFCAVSNMVIGNVVLRSDSDKAKTQGVCGALETIVPFANSMARVWWFVQVC